MDSKGKLAIYILFFIVIGFLIYITFYKSPNNHLDAALRSLDSARKRLDTALVKIDDSKKVIDSMRANFTSFQDEVKIVGSGVKKLNADAMTNAQRFATSLKEIKLRNQEVVNKLKISRDTLPEIKIYKYEN